MPRVLIVEDDLGFRTMLETMIRLEGYDVFLAANGETGFAQAQTRKPEIVLSDIEMPGLKGFDLVRKIKATPDIAGAYVILITGQGGQDSKLDALRAGADDFLEKPSSRQEILGRLEIAQKVIGVQQQQREAEARAKTLEEVPRNVATALDAVDRGLQAIADAIAKKNPQALVLALQQTREAAALARGACKAAPPQPEGSWL